MRFLDADIVIDLLRGHLPAIDWFESLDDPDISVPGYVVMELIQGTTNQRQLNHLLRMISQWPVYWPNPEVCGRALGELARFHLSHRLGPFDALIAESASSLGATLCTFNVKHFRPLVHVTTEQPYER